MKEETKDIEALSKPLESDIDHLSILHSMYFKYSDRGFPISNLMRYFLNGLDDIPTQKVKHLWNKKAYEQKRKLFVDSYPEMLEILQKDYDSFKFNFQIINYQEFNITSFCEYPIWSEYYDYTELNQLVEWGFDKNLVFQQLQQKQINNNHPFYTVPISSFPLNRMRYFTKSTFRTRENYKLNGAIMNNGEMVILLFLDNEIEFLNNNHILRKQMNESLTSIANHFQLDVNELLELKFETVIPSDRSKRIKGVWKAKNET